MRFANRVWGLRLVFPAGKIIRSVFFFSLTIASANTIALAQDVRAIARVDSNNVLIGDWLRLHIEVRHPRNITVTFPTTPDSLEGFEIIRRDAPSTKSTAQELVESSNFTITAFDTGTLVIPPLVFQYNTKGDSTKHTVETSPIPVFVHGIKVDTTQEIKDVKPPLSVPITWADVLPYIIGIAVVGGAVWLVFYVRRKMKRGEKILPEGPPRPAHEVALDALRALEAEHLWQRGKVKEYHSQLTDILRVYIERTFGVMAMEMTSEEILGSAPIRDVQKEMKEKLRETLTRADLVKFAKFQPLPQEHESSLQLAISFVESTSQPARQPAAQELVEEAKV